MIAVFSSLDFYFLEKRCQSILSLNDLSFMNSNEIKDNLKNPVVAPLLFLSPFLSSEGIAISNLYPHPRCLCLGFSLLSHFSFQST